MPSPSCLISDANADRWQKLAPPSAMAYASSCSGLSRFPLRSSLLRSQEMMPLYFYTNIVPSRASVALGTYPAASRALLYGEAITKYNKTAVVLCGGRVLWYKWVIFTWWSFHHSPKTPNNLALLSISHTMLFSLAKLTIFSTSLFSLSVQTAADTQCRNPAVRKEWRKLTTPEKADWIRAVNASGTK